MDCLLLNADGAPVTFLPLSLIDWQESIKYLVLEKATALAYHDNWIVRSARWETQVPSILMLHDYQKPKHTIRFSKANVFLRDNYTCAYCAVDLTKKECTLDHVLPTSHGGKTTFENTVCACGRCNANKGNDARIKPKFKPHKPDFYELINKRKKLGWNVKNTDWLEYLQ